MCIVSMTGNGNGGTLLQGEGGLPILLPDVVHPGELVVVLPVLVGQTEALSEGDISSILSSWRRSGGEGGVG